MTRAFGPALTIIPPLLLAVLSVTVLSSIAPGKVLYQALYLLAAILSGWGVFSIGLRNLLLFTKPLYLLTVCVLFLTILVGSASRGSMRWLEVWGVRIQFSELAKPILVLTLAPMLAASWPNELRNQLVRLFTVGFLIAPLLILVFLQPDLGTGLILFAIAGLMVFVSGIPGRIVVSLLVITLLALPLARRVLAPYQQARIDSFFNPYSDPHGTGYSAIQSTIAIGSGQLFGRGLGRGTQSQLQFLPERQTDFIFASIVEEFGLAGGIVVLVLFWVPIGTFIDGAIHARERSGALVLTGCAVWLFVQSTVNILMNLGLAPVTGIPLPFLSAGGSSLVSGGILIGLASSALSDFRTSRV